MSDLPKYFEFRIANGERSNMHPFIYDHDKSEFQIDDKRVGLLDFDPYTFNPHDIGLEFEGVEVDRITESPVILPSFSAVIGGPNLHEWIANNRQLVSEATKVMKAAFVQFFDDESFIAEINDDQSGSHMGFMSGVREDGGLGLQVFGDCACLGPDPNGMFLDGQFEKGFASYDLHNADSQSQRASLYAGIGHLGLLASES